MRATAVRAMHAASASSLDARTVSQTTAELEKRSGDFVTKTRLALVVVMRGRAAREETSAAGSSSSGGGGGRMVMSRAS